MLFSPAASGLLIPDHSRGILPAGGGGGSDWWSDAWAYDDFSSGDFTSPQGTPTFETWGDQGIRAATPHNGSLSVSSANPLTGSYHARLTFNGTADLSGDAYASSVELNWGWSTHTPGEIWFREKVYIPSNYAHRVRTGATTNNKWVKFWENGYTADPSCQVAFSMRPGASEISKAQFEWSYAGSPAVGPWEIQLGQSPDTDPFISASDKGTWIDIIAYAKMSTSDSANDGVYKLGRSYSGVLQWDWTDSDLDLHVTGSGVRGWAEGYLFGWASTGYLNTTHFDIDAVGWWITQPSWAVGL